MPNQPCYFLFTISDFLNLPETSFLIISIIVPMYQFFLPIDKKARHGFLDPRYFSQVAIQHTSKMFFSIERVHPLSAWEEKWCLSLDQKSAKFSRSAAETGGASFQPSSGYSSKLWVSPEWLTLGMMGGYKRNQYVLNICRTKNTVNSIIKCEE